MLELDPNLKTPRGEALRILLYLFERDDAVKLIWPVKDFHLTALPFIRTAGFIYP